ncbi:hypothetical protein [uncultured Croceitalea sp.]|uniref:hypothetical protein n=1 Tax=uncultured Croceitalea sp. TaxID=1798908 RepID=UPI0033058E21
MSNQKPSILYLTDFYYPAKGREYYKEDLYIISQLKNDFELIICHPIDSKNYEALVDLVMFRNTGSVMYYKTYFENFVARTNSNTITTYNEMIGKGDMLGKQHLLDLTALQYPVIPTVESFEDLRLLPSTKKYLLKLKNGADSIGMKSLSYKELISESIQDYVIQPFIDFVYEVSFYFIDHEFQYALYAPNKNKRWDLEEYTPTKDDLVFANKFILWNDINYGIQRVDACRLESGKLLLVELEDLNPFLSIEALQESKKQKFMAALKTSIKTVINNKK